MPIFMKLDGIDGEATSKGHEKWIEVLSFSWGATNSGSQSPGGGGGAGKVSLQDFHFVHPVDKASPKLLSAVCDGLHIKSGVLSVNEASGASKGGSEYILIKLQDVLVSGIRPGANAATDDRALEAVSLNFTSIEAQYTGEDGEVVGSGGDRTD
jgi:type VI secretion system secreted protein Hcp